MRTEIKQNFSAGRRLALFTSLLVLPIVNPLTKAQLINGSQTGKSNELRLKVRQIYTSQIGVREKQPNSGPAVEKYLRYVNLPKGNPWCAAFVCWVYGQAGVENPRTGWSPDLFWKSKVIWERKSEQGIRSKEQRRPQGVPFESRTWSQEPRLSLGLPYPNPSSLTTGNRQLATHPSSLVTDNWQLTTEPRQLTDPSPGDIFGLYFVEKKRIAHVGFIDKWDGTWLISVEGNTNASGSREGDGVYRKRRLVRSIYKVARYVPSIHSND